MAHNEIATSPQREEQQSSPDSQVKLGRRQLLTTGTVATAAALLPGSGTAEATTPHYSGCPRILSRSRRQFFLIPTATPTSATYT